MEIPQVVEWIKTRISLDFPETRIKLEVEKEDNRLSGHTIIKKVKDEIVVLITLHVSENLFERKGIKQATKLILIHEFCHVVSPANPDSIMEKYFPKEFEIWQMAKEQNGLKCSHEYKIGNSKR